MNKIFSLAIMLCTSFTIFSQTGDVTTYYLIRHAEKITSNPADVDPDLTLEGINRAKKWVSVFAPTKIDAVYSSEFRRTKQTAKPIADSKKLPVYSFDLKTMYDPAFKYNTKGLSVIVVGHSNSTPQLANMMIGEEKYPNINDSEHGYLYIITITKDKTTSTLVNID